MWKRKNDQLIKKEAVFGEAGAKFGKHQEDEMKVKTGFIPVDKALN